MPYPDNILCNVTKPARYTGGEWNSIKKDWHNTDIKIAISYPDTYEIGMSNIALTILYNIINSQSHTLAERVFAPWPDMASAMESAGIPLLSLESGHPLNEFDIIGFSLGYELTFTNVINMLHLSRIPVFAKVRNDSHPIIIAGGSCTLNPEPMADFFDFFVIGEAEQLLPQLIACIRDWKGKKASKEVLLHRVATIPGIYVPSLYDVKYHSNGLFKSINPKVVEANPLVKRQIIPKLPPPVTKPVVPFIEVIHNRGAIEVSRGCTRGCRFCNAGIIYRPVRKRPKEEVLKAVDELIKNCGYNEVSLVSLNTSDYNGIDTLITEIAHRYGKQNLAVSLPSLRISCDSIKLINSLPTHRRTGLTLAPETGSNRLRRVINKFIPEDELLATTAFIFEKGWHTLKLYFLIGLPTETNDDITAIAHFVNKIHSIGNKVASRRPQIRVSLSPFVPKPHTPFQWVAAANEQQLVTKIELLRLGLRRKGVKLSWQEPKMSLIEAAISRGDRRLSSVIYRAWQLGAKFDGWNEYFNHQIWLQAFQEANLKPEFYTQRHRSLDESLPWDHIDTGIKPGFLKKEYMCAIEEKLTPDCHLGGCSTCGLEQWKRDCQEKQMQL